MKMWKKRMRGGSDHNHTTKVIVKFDVGFNNAVHIRGHGGGLNWEKGKLMKNTGTDTWVWETDLPCENCEFKVLINDERFENGQNHRLNNGKTVQYTPNF